jgi:SsrA-binding protein
MEKNFSLLNRKARFNYTLGQSWECGLMLQGSEVKSVRAGHVNFKDTFARVEKGEAFLYNLHIDPYQEASYMNPEPDRVRKLLLHKTEIKKMGIQVVERGKVLVPTKLYINNRGLVKVEIAVGTGKKLFDKREGIKKRDTERSLRRSVGTRR